MRLRRRTWLLVATALTTSIGAGTLSLVSLGGSQPSTAGLALSPAQSFQTSSETIGGCEEGSLDHGHDVDPPGFIDQEDDECLPSQHALRNPDGSLASVQP